MRKFDLEERIINFSLSIIELLKEIPTHYLDQGAHKAIEIAEVPNRYLAGITEVALKDHVAD